MKIAELRAGDILISRSGIPETVMILKKIPSDKTQGRYHIVYWFLPTNRKTTAYSENGEQDLFYLWRIIRDGEELSS